MVSNLHFCIKSTKPGHASLQASLKPSKKSLFVAEGDLSLEPHENVISRVIEAISAHMIDYVIMCWSLTD